MLTLSYYWNPLNFRKYLFLELTKLGKDNCQSYRDPFAVTTREISWRMMMCSQNGRNILPSYFDSRIRLLLQFVVIVSPLFHERLTSCTTMIVNLVYPSCHLLYLWPMMLRAPFSSFEHKFCSCKLFLYVWILWWSITLWSVHEISLGDFQIIIGGII